MEPDRLDEGQRAAITALLDREQVDRSYLAFVTRHVDANDATWRWCCGSACDPCVERLGRVVDAARHVLCRKGPGLPKPRDPA